MVGRLFEAGLARHLEAEVVASSSTASGSSGGRIPSGSSAPAVRAPQPKQW